MWIGARLGRESIQQALHQATRCESILPSLHSVFTEDAFHATFVLLRVLVSKQRFQICHKLGVPSRKFVAPNPSIPIPAVSEIFPHRT
ncbi:hypothetical protein ASE28_24215 [Acidovorax sp. Root219]|nr:hypothetical protein ASE28_24215 [Acidovorax sp. Root219]